MLTRSFGATEPSLAISLSLFSITTLVSPFNSSHPEAKDRRRIQAAESIVYHADGVLLYTTLGRRLGRDAQDLEQPFQTAGGEPGVPALEPALIHLAIQVLEDGPRQHRLTCTR